MKKAAIYLRVSTLDQNYDRQEFELKQLATALGYEVVAVFEEKKSAVLDMETREQLDKMRKLTKNDIDKIFIWDISRLSRKATNFITLVNEFADKGICLHFKDRNIITLNDEGKLDGFTSIFLYILGVFAQMEAENLKVKMRSGKENALRRGNSYTNLAPFGYYLEDKKLYIYEEEAKYVRLAFNLYKDGYDRQYITDIFNAKKVPLKSKRTDIVWIKGTIYQILKNTVYMGKGKYVTTEKDKKTGKRVPVNKRFCEAPAIISEDLFKLVQSQLSANSSRSNKSKKIESLLRGIIKCTECNKYYSVAYNNKHIIYKDADYRANVNNKVGCKNGSINLPLTDKLVWETIKDIYKLKIFKDECAKNKKENKFKYDENTQQILELREKIDNLNKEQSKNNSLVVKGIFSEDDYVVERDRINNELDRINHIIEDKIAENSMLLDKIEYDYDFDKFEQKEPTFVEKKQIFKDLIEEVLVESFGKFKRIIHIRLKIGLFFNIMIDTNRSNLNYYTFNDNDIQYMAIHSILNSKMEDNLKDNLRNIINDLRIRNKELFPELTDNYVSLENFWELLRKKKLLKNFELDVTRETLNKGA